MANVPYYPPDTTTNVIIPPSGAYNSNASSVQPSSIGTSATGDFYIFRQTMYFALKRQKIIVPNSPWVDENTAVDVNQSFAATETHNRLLIGGEVTIEARIEPSATYNVVNARVPLTLVAYGAASGLSGNGIYTSGVGSVYPLQLGYLRRYATSADTAYGTQRQFYFSLFERPGSWSATDPGEPINYIVRLVAQRIQSSYEPLFDPNLISI